MAGNKIKFKIKSDRFVDLISKLDDLTKIEDVIKLKIDNDNILLYSMMGGNVLLAFKNYLIKTRDYLEYVDDLEFSIDLIIANAKKFVKNLNFIEILDMMVEEGFSVENIAFGMGGALLQKVDRDTQKFAFKCSSIVIDGEEVEVRKNPIEINERGERVTSFKRSKGGRLKLVNGETIEHSKDEIGDELVEVFLNGEIIKEWTFEEIRERAQVEL
mgnify:CR=1 FL=1